MSKIKQKQEELTEWQERLDYYKKVEPQISKGSNEGFQNHKNIKEAEQVIADISDKIQRLKKQDKKGKTIDLSSDIPKPETLHQALDLFIQQKDNLDHRSSFNDLEEAEKLKNELFEKIIVGFKDKISHTPILQNKFIINLFENIISSEKLSKTIIDDIVSIRIEKENYKHYERSVIVSALTLSVLGWKKFDAKKMNFLIDFLTDYEENVWERALTGVILSSIIHQNRLQRYQITNRLVELQKNEKVQISIYLIDTILRNQLYGYVLFPTEFEKQKFLNETPYNWFLPFYKDNKTVKEMFRETEQDIDEEDFLQYIYKVPMVNAYKYTICNGIKNNQIRVSKKSFDKNSDEDLMRLRSLSIATNFDPFYNHIAEFYLYYKFYPKGRVKKIFSHKITLANTKLKNIILSKVQELKLSADLFFEKEEYGSCILKLKELLNIEPSQLSALIQMSECYEAMEEYSEALTYHYEIEKIKPKNFTNQFKIGLCLNETKQYKKSIEYLVNADKLKSNNFNVLSLIGRNYYLLKEYKKSIKYHNMVLINEKKHERSLRDINLCYNHLNEPKKAIKYSLKLYEINPENPDYLMRLALDYSELDDYVKAKEFASKAFIIDSEDIDIAFGYGRVLFVCSDFEKSEIMLNKALKMKNSKEFLGIIYGNLGHLALFEDNITKSNDYYQRCVLGFDDINEFSEKFDTDLPYALRNGVSKSKYEKIKQKMIEYWRKNN